MRGQASLIRQVDVAPGGTGLNVAIGLARLRLPVTFIGTFGNDFFGEYLREAAIGEGIDLAVGRRSNLPTRIVLIRVNNVGQPAFLAFNRPSADDDLKYEKRFTKHIRHASILFVSGLSLRFEPSRSCVLSLMTLARRHKVPVVFDPNIRTKKTITKDDRDTLRVAKQLADIYLPTANEDKLVGGSQASSSRAIVVIKRGAHGCVLGQDGDAISFRPPKVRLIDATGAGDAFNAGFLSALYRQHSLGRACKLGNVCGSIATTALGASRALPNLRTIRPYAKSLT